MQTLRRGPRAGTSPRIRPLTTSLSAISPLRFKRAAISLFSKMDTAVTLAGPVANLTQAHNAIAARWVRKLTQENARKWKYLSLRSAAPENASSNIERFECLAILGNFRCVAQRTSELEAYTGELYP